MTTPKLIFTVVALLMPASTVGSDNCDVLVPLALGPGSSAYEAPLTRKAAPVWDAHEHEYYIDRFGKRVPEPTYPSVLDPPPNAKVFPCERPRFSGRLGFCDKSGAIKVQPQFSDLGNFVENLAFAATFETKEYGFIDETGAWKIPPSPKYRIVEDFHDGLAAVDLCGKCAYLNHEGAQAFAATFFQCFNFAEGIGKVRPKENETAFIDKAGKVIASLRGNWTEDAYLSGGLIPSQQGELIGFVNKKGEWVIPARFEGIRPFVEGVAAVKEKNLWGYIDPSGKYVIPPKYADLDKSRYRDFSEGLAFDCDAKTGLCGYIDHPGKFVIAPRFNPCGDEDLDQCSFSGGLARVVTKTRIGFINDKGVYVWSQLRRR